MITVFLEGLGMCAGLIVAIGAQNAFVLRQGIRRQRRLEIALFCALTDALLITAGVWGLGTAINQVPLVLRLATGAGCVFLAWYGIRSLRSMVKPAVLDAAGGPPVPADGMDGEAAGDHPAAGPRLDPLGPLLASLAAFTLLNPHVWLDTVVLLGAAGARHPPAGRAAFVLGACSASLAWFFALAFGAGFLAPLFRRALTWRILDGLIGILMLFIASQLGIWAWNGPGG